MSRPSRDFTLRTSPLSAVMVPRTRTLVWASTLVVMNARASNARVLIGGSPCMAGLTPVFLRAFHAESVPRRRKDRGTVLQQPAGQFSKQAPHRVVRSQPPRRRARLV